MRSAAVKKAATHGEDEMRAALVADVQKAFENEANALTGKDMVGLSELTNHLLRLAWPFMLRAQRK